MALIYDSSVAGSKSSYIYAELLEQGMEIDGDRVLISLPMTRINEAQLKVVVSAGCGIESAWLVRHKPLLGAVIDASNHKPSNCIIYVRPQAEATMIEGRDLDWGSAVAQAKAADCVPVEASDPLDILCTSGTTGRPNGMVRDNGGHAVAMTWFMRYIYNVRPRDVCWTAIVVCRLIVCSVKESHTSPLMIRKASTPSWIRLRPSSSTTTPISLLLTTLGNAVCPRLPPKQPDIHQPKVGMPVGEKGGISELR